MIDQNDESLTENNDLVTTTRLFPPGMLPTTILYPYSGGNGKLTLESWGVKFLGIVEYNDALQRVEFPLGWHVKNGTTEESFFLKDGKGRVRCNLIYYRHALKLKTCMFFCTRYCPVLRDYGSHGDFVEIVFDRDEDKEIYRGVPIKPDSIMEEDTNLLHDTPRVSSEAEKWLDEHYPEWRDPAAYRD